MSNFEQNGVLALKLTLWAGTGVLLNMFALGMMRSPLKSRPLTYVGMASGSTIVGYVTSRIYDYRKERLEVERDRITKRRMLSLGSEA
ncbi:hypothetical protein HDU97_001215 [Phlyctochytrium planicorne]|nr:hypothetical protein HDU97_001215 [Phlyctochytrium planicorne]